jgi:hypothetical protein
MAVVESARSIPSNECDVSPGFYRRLPISPTMIVGVEVVIAPFDMEVIQLRWRKYPDTPQERKKFTSELSTQWRS